MRSLLSSLASSGWLWVASFYIACSLFLKWFPENHLSENYDIVPWNLRKVLLSLDGFTSSSLKPSNLFTVSHLGRQAGRQLVSSVVPECTSSYALSQLPVFEKLGRNFSHLRLSCFSGKHTRRRTCALLLYLLNGSETKVVGKRHARRENFSLNPFHRCWLLTGLIVVLTDVLMAFRPKVQRKSILGSSG